MIIGSTQTEAGLQKAIIRALDAIPFSARKFFCFHPANGEKRPPKTAALLKAMGVRPGVPDLVFLARSGAFFIELKRPTKTGRRNKPVEGKLSDKQIIVRDIIDSYAMPYAVHDSLDGVLNQLEKWGLL